MVELLTGGGGWWTRWQMKETRNIKSKLIKCTIYASDCLPVVGGLSVCVWKERNLVTLRVLMRTMTLIYMPRG